MSRLPLLVSLVALTALTACSKEPSGDTGVPQAAAADVVRGVKLASLKGDSAAGGAVFAQCMACHVTEAGVNRMGPSLHAVVGRKAGSIDGFRYSPAMKASGVTWSEAKLFEYLEAPRRVVPGTTMGFAGLANPQQRADVIAYLKANAG
ncbi:cytochrome c family protein [Sphingomonas sp.]|uniref:c-type cytochrome n=1 Tax=Sphingomonas sp. TaxID=28214 RepID=UPI0025D1B14C|nr:cytochrome c family protein [Sphingomonas sp.]